MHGDDESLEGEESESEVVLLVEGEEEVEHCVENEEGVLLAHVPQQLVSRHQEGLLEAGFQAMLQQGEDVGLGAGPRVFCLFRFG